MASDPSNQRLVVRGLFERHKLQKGDTWYAVEYRWWKSWKDYVSYEAKDAGFAKPGPRPPPMDNTDLLDPDNKIRMKPGLQEHYHFEMVPKQVYDKLVEWYGGGPGIARKVITRGNSTIGETEVVELYPFLATVHRTKENGEPDLDNPVSMLISSRDGLGEVITRFKEKDKDYTSEYRLWIEGENESKEKTWALVSGMGLSKSLEEMEINGDIRLMIDKKQAGKNWNREHKEPDWRSELKISDLVDALDKMNKWYESSIRDIKDGKLYIHYVNWPAKWDEWIAIDSDRIAKVHTHTTGPHQRRNSGGGGYFGGSYNSNDEGQSLQKGIVGLRNLGNTCFMNSTLQCLTATECMLDYWLKEKYAQELNPENPLGWQGKVANQYGALVKDIWSGKYRVVAPRDFKQVIGEFQPRFSGYNQQDSSELLSFLLDGIHEDLNRVKKKPYTEAVESKGREDDLVAKDFWDTHKKRHDSIIVDQFQGQLKSKVVCPTCNKVSVTFDPYMFLSVPLPTKLEKVIEVMVVPANPAKSVTAYGIRAPQMGSVLDLKAEIAKVTGIKLQRLVVGEVWKGKVYKFFPNNHLLGDIRPADDTYAWEVPAMDEEKEQKENDRKIPYDFMSAQFFVSREESGWMGKKVVTQPVGVPLPVIIPVDGKIRGVELHHRAQQISKSFFLGDGEGDSIFRLRTLDFGGGLSKEIQPNSDAWEVDGRSCLGIEILDIERFNEDRAAKFQAHESAPSKRAAAAGSRVAKESVSLADCINSYTAQETLTEQNAWFCPGCKDFKCASKKFDIWSVPKVLIVHLKRFQYSNMYRDKIDTFVDFPIEGLDMSSWVIGPQTKDGNSVIYDLYGISNHMGGLGGGHYTAYIKSSVDGKWYDMNDSSAAAMGSSEIKSSSAYVLFYQRRES